MYKPWFAATVIAALMTGPVTAQAQDLASEKGKASYALGYRAGLDVARVNSEDEQIDIAAALKGFQDAATRKDPAMSPEQLSAAMQRLQARLVAKAKDALARRAAENKTQGDAALAQHRSRAGVKVLASGVQYRVIETGSGTQPTTANQITVEFKTVLPDGKVVADTAMASEGQPAGPVTVRLSEIPLPGLREALQLMPAGSRWEVYLPGSQAHGSSVEHAGEMANQVLIFDIKLTHVGPEVPAPAG